MVFLVVTAGGGVIVGVHMVNEREAGEMLRALEAGMRAGQRSAQLEDWRRQLLNMRWRAFVEDWSGWA